MFMAEWKLGTKQSPIPSEITASFLPFAQEIIFIEQCNAYSSLYALKSHKTFCNKYQFFMKVFAPNYAWFLGKHIANESVKHGMVMM